VSPYQGQELFSCDATLRNINRGSVETGAPQKQGVKGGSIGSFDGTRR